MATYDISVYELSLKYQRINLQDIGIRTKMLRFVKPAPVVCGICSFGDFFRFVELAPVYEHGSAVWIDNSIL